MIQHFILGTSILWLVVVIALPVAWCFRSPWHYGKRSISLSPTVMRVSLNSPVNKFKYLLETEITPSPLTPIQIFAKGVESFLLDTPMSPFTLSFAAESPLSKLKDFVKSNPLLNLVEEKGEPQLTPQPPSSLPFTGTPDQLIVKAREVIASDLAILPDYHDIIDENFIWIGPYTYGKPLGKQDYIAAGQFFDLRSTFPDLDYRAYDYRISSEDPYTVRVTCRVAGTMRGDLRLRSETLPPNGKRMFCPPEAISMTFDPQTGKLKKLCSGFTMDRLVGNTKGLCGVMAAAVIAGSEPSIWDIYPPTVVAQRFFGRKPKQIEDASTTNTPTLAPFPETVMVQLAKGVIAANNGASNPDLLAPSFTFCGPLVGPIDKDAFIKAFGSFQLNTAFPDLDVDYQNFRVDPFDPFRVWVDVRATGTNTGAFLDKEPTGKSVVTPPEAVSFTFDAEGFCTRLTAGVVMDPSLGKFFLENFVSKLLSLHFILNLPILIFILKKFCLFLWITHAINLLEGNTGGLGGLFGILYAIGRGFPDISTRPWPEIIARLQKSLLSPLTGVGVDEYLVPPSQAVAPSASTLKTTVDVASTISTVSETEDAVPDEPSPSMLESFSRAFTPTRPDITATEVKVTPKLPTPPAIPPPPKAEASAKDVKETSVLPTPPAVPPPSSKVTVPKGDASTQISENPADPVSDAFKNLFGLGRAGEKSTEKAVVAAETLEKPPAGVKVKTSTEPKKSKETVEKQKEQVKEERLEVEKLKRAQEAKERAEQEKQKKEQEAVQRQERLELEKQKKELEAKERLEREKQKKDQEAIQRQERLELEKLKKEQEAKERLEREKQKKEQEAALRQERLELEKQRREQEAKERLEREKQKREQEAIQRLEDAKKREEKAKTSLKAAQQAKQEKVVQQAKPGATIRLFDFFAGREEEEEVGKSSSVESPKGIPVLSKWRKNLDGSVSGIISGSKTFADGEAITTSPLKGEPVAGSVAVTQTGSR
jgi:hypothetical protein